MREQFYKRKYGKTREERLAKKAELRKIYKARVREVEDAEVRDAELGVGTPKEHLTQRRETAKARSLLGFIDIEIDENGEKIPAEEGIGVHDKVLEDLNIRRTKYEK